MLVVEVGLQLRVPVRQGGSKTAEMPGLLEALAEMELAACARAEEKEATKQPLALVGQLVDLGAMLVPCLGLMGSQTMAGMVVPIHALRGQTGCGLWRWGQMLQCKCCLLYEWGRGRRRPMGRRRWWMQ